MSDAIPNPEPEPEVPVLWRKEAPVRTKGEPTSSATRRNLFLMLMAFLGVFGIIYLVLLWLRPAPRPQIMSGWVTEYTQLPFAQPPFAEQDQKILTGSEYFERMLPTPGELPKLEKQNTVVVVLSGLARVDEEGKLLYLPSDAEPNNTKTYRPLSQLLQTLASARSRHKLLVLDLFWPIDDPYLNELTHDLAGKVQEELDAVPDPARLTLVSCSPGQTPLASADLGRSVFGYYFEEGLRGWADFPSEDPDFRGLVTARRLGEFVQARVERWAMQNLGKRQSPQMLGDAADFGLEALDRGIPKSHVGLKETPAYPEWLNQAWKTRDRWRADERYRVTPWLFRQVEVLTMQADRGWRTGMREEPLKKQYAAEMDRLERSFHRLSALAGPEPVSLAQAVAAGQKPDLPLLETLREFPLRVEEARLAAPKADEAEKAVLKLMLDMREVLKKKSDFEASYAIFEALASDPFPRRDTVLIFDRLHSFKLSEPRYAETLALRRLAQMANEMTEATWPARSARKFLDLTQRGEQSLTRPLTTPWIGASLELASRTRHKAEFLFFARGFASLDQADQFLTQAVGEFETIQARQDIFESALKLHETAQADLPEFLAYIHRTDRADTAWMDAVEGAIQLGAILNEQVTPAELGARTDEARQKSAALASAMATLRGPFQKDSIDDAVSRAQRPDANCENLAELEALLASSLLKADQRTQLWPVARALGTKLATKTLTLDEEDKQAAPNLAEIPPLPTGWAKKEAEQGIARAKHGIELLRLLGLKESQIQPLKESLGVAEASDDPLKQLHQHYELIRQTWTQDLPRYLREEQDPARRERMSRIAPGWLRVGSGEDALARAAAPRWQQTMRAHWAWLGDWYRFESTEAGASPFYSRAAFVLRQFASPSAFNLVGPRQPSTLEVNQTDRQSQVKIPWTLTGKSPPLTGRVYLADDDWLGVTLDASPLDGLDNRSVSDGPVSFSLPVKAVLQPNVEYSTTPRPKGFVVEIDAGGRTWHHLVTLPFLPSPDQAEILLSADAKNGADPLGDLRLRPGKDRQAFYVYIRNPSDRAKQFTLEVRQDDRVVKGGAVALIIGARQTSRVVFPGTPPEPNKIDPAKEAPVLELPLLSGPLQFRLYDKEKNNELVATRDVKVAIANPREYVRVPNIRFIPANAEKDPNRLEVTLKAATPLKEPPCEVELVLPPDRIPGLVTVRDGAFRGILPPLGGDLKLYASDLTFEPGADEEGFAYLTIDGVERAMVFRVTYARVGEPTVPRQEDRPAIRMNTARYFRTNTRWEGIAEVDNAPAGSSIVVSLGKFDSGAFRSELSQNPKPPRQVGVGWTLRHEDGGIEFEAFQRDWKLAFPNVGTRGERVIELRLIDGKGRDILPPVYQTVVFDDHLPEEVQFVDLPKAAKLGTLLEVKARGLDRVVGLKEVTFFLGPLTEDKKLPPNAVKAAAQPSVKEQHLYVAALPLPADKKGPIEVGVIFTNQVGLKSAAKGTVELVDFDPVKNAPSIIKGVVSEGDIPQVGLVVQLFDLKGAKLAETKTKADGAFAIEQVPPGKYIVFVTKPSSMRQRQEQVEVLPGQTVNVRLRLFL